MSKNSENNNQTPGSKKGKAVAAAVLIAAVLLFAAFVLSRSEIVRQSDPGEQTNSIAEADTPDSEEDDISRKEETKKEETETENTEEIEKETEKEEVSEQDSEGTGHSDAEISEVISEAQFPIVLGQGLNIIELAPYTGAYMEDGTDEIVSDVLMAILENTSDQALQHAKITLHFGETQAEFSVTNLPAGEKVVLLEQSRMAYTANAPELAEIQDTAFLERMELYPEIFEITGEKGAVTVKNISDTEISGDIYVYYKNCAADLYYGGITYRTRVEGGLAAGESKQAIAAHYNPNGSSVEMVSYIP